MTRYDFVNRPTRREQREVVRWLERHGIDPLEVPTDGWIDVDRDGCRVTYESYVFESDGAGGRRVKLAEGSLSAERTERVVEVGSPPSPFPTVGCVNLS